MENAGWRYRARTPDGEVRTGTVQAASRDDARRALSHQGLIADVVRPAPQDKSFRLRRRPSIKALSVYTRQFATLMESGIHLLLALDILESLTDDLSLRIATQKIGTALQAGANLSDAMRVHPLVFSPIYIFMVEAGEQSGTLDVSLSRLAIYLEKSHALREKIKAAMTYPVLIAVVAVLSVVAMLTLVVPAFEEMFRASGVSLPYTTQLLVDLSRWLAGNWIFLGLGLLVVGLIIEQARNTKAGRLFRDRLLLALPVVGDLAKKAAVARFTRTSASLLSAGIPILDVVEVAAGSSGNAIMERSILASQEGIAAGLGVSEPLSQSRVLPRLLSQMVKIGEETGRLDEMFGRVADFYEQEVDSAVEGLVKTLEPLMVVVVGVMMGGMVVSMYLPIFEAIALPAY